MSTPNADYGADYTAAERVAREQYADADPRTIRAALRRLRAAPPHQQGDGTYDGTLVTVANIAAERGVQIDGSGSVMR